MTWIDVGARPDFIGGGYYWDDGANARYDIENKMWALSIDLLPKRWWFPTEDELIEWVDKMQTLVQPLTREI